MHVYIHCRIIHDSQDMKAAQVLIDRWMDKKGIYIYIYTHIYIFQGVCIYIWYIYVCIHIYGIYICMCVCVCVCVYIYIYLYIFSGILLSPKREWNLVICTTKMDIQGIMVTEINHKEKDKSCITSLMCGIPKIKQMNKHNKTETKS